MTKSSDKTSSSKDDSRGKERKPAVESQAERRSRINRRKGWGTLVYYLAGGSEHRTSNDRRDTGENENDSHNGRPDTRPERERRQRKMDSMYLYSCNIMDRRDGVRRKKDLMNSVAGKRKRSQQSDTK